MINKTGGNIDVDKKMRKTMRSTMVLVVTASLLCWSSRASLLGNSFKLEIRNDMGVGRILKAECKSNNKETSAQELQPGEAMSMVLADKLFNRSEVGCQFSVGSGSGKPSGHFKVFEEGETGYACGDVCRYSVREDGLWMYDFRDAEWELKGKWLLH